MMILILPGAGGISAQAAGKTADKVTATEVARGLTRKTKVELDQNIRHTTYRHIKVRWKKTGCITAYQIQIANNRKYRQAISSMCSEGHGLYWNFSITDHMDDAYYIRVRPVYNYRNKDGKWMRLYGRWSRSVTVE